MLTRYAFALALVAVTACAASAQTARTLRFHTNAGSFDMELNPTNDPNLRGLVNNLLAYVGTGAYDFTAINRAHENGPGTADDFVLQMGSFLAGPTIPELWASIATPIAKYDAVVVDANGDGQVDFNALSNTRGTVSLALQAGNANSGTSSFFINSGDNSLLDDQGFVPFARITNMSDIDRIMQLQQTDLTQEAGTSPSNLAFSDVPLTSMNEIVYISEVEVLQADAGFSFVGPIASVLDLMKARAATANASSAALAASGQTAALSAAGLPPVTGGANISAVPEPSTVAISVAGMFATFLAGRRWTKR